MEDGWYSKVAEVSRVDVQKLRAEKICKCNLLLRGHTVMSGDIFGYLEVFRG